MENRLITLKKQIIKSITDVLILQALKNDDLCGNEIVNELHSRFGITNYGKVYSILSILTKNGLITYKNNPNSKKLYSLTEKGELARKEMLEQYFDIHTKITNYCFI